MNISFLSTNSILILLLTGGLLGLAGAIISTGKFIRNSY
jgi:hypothetical protein